MRYLDENLMPKANRSCLLLVNPVSGGGKSIKEYKQIQQQLNVGGFQVRTHISIDEVDLANQVRSAHEPIVFLLGGDGSLRTAAEVIVMEKKNISLAPLPSGRGNDFCAALGIPKKPELAAAKVIEMAEQIDVDVISINQQKVALGAVSIGIDAAAAEISFEIQKSGNKWLKGAPLYVFSALKALISWQARDIQVSLDCGASEKRKIWLFVISNSGQFGGGMKISPTSKLQDGVLEVIAVGEVSKFDFLRTLPKVFFGKHLSHPKLEMFNTREIFLKSDEPILAFADGEPISATPLHVSILPNALKILK